MGHGIEELHLTTNEQSELAALEAVIERGLNTFVEVGNALLQIRESKLYRAFGTFEDYCRVRWGMVASRARQLIAAAEITENIKSVTVVTLLPQTESQARPLAQLEPEQQREAWSRAVETAPNGKVTAAHVAQVVGEIKTGSAPHVSFNTGESEWYTPQEYIDAAREVMGEIDLDPASCEIANRTVQADEYYTAEQDGLTKEWFGRVWMNPPYASALVAQFAEKLTDGALRGDILEAIALVNNATETKWFARLIEAASAVCFPTGRVRFLDPQGNPGAPLQGQALIYIGKNRKAFLTAFAQFGWCASL